MLLSHVPSQALPLRLASGSQGAEGFRYKMQLVGSSDVVTWMLEQSLESRVPSGAVSSTERYGKFSLQRRCYWAFGPGQARPPWRSGTLLAFPVPKLLGWDGMCGALENPRDCLVTCVHWFDESHALLWYGGACGPFPPHAHPGLSCPSGGWLRCGLEFRCWD